MYILQIIPYLHVHLEYTCTCITGKKFKFPVPGNLHDRCWKGDMSYTWLSRVLLQEIYSYPAHFLVQVRANFWVLFPLAFLNT